MNDEKIISGIRKGDESAINYVIEKYSKLMWHIAGAVLKNVASEQDIEECVADVFIYLWKNPEKYQAEKGKLKSWLSIVARSKAIDRYRQLTKVQYVSLEAGSSDSNGLLTSAGLLVNQLEVMDGILEEETQKMLYAAMKELEEQDRDILIRRYFYEQKPKEISIALNIPVKQVENRLYRAKLKLRAAIAD